MARARLPIAVVSATVLAWGLAPGPAPAQDDDPAAWSEAAARGAFDLCRADAPDAAEVTEHGEVWGWPPFAGYLAHPDGYRREAGGESRRHFAAGDKTAYVELTVQSGEVVSAAPAQVRYFRCNIASDQPVNAGLEAYFTAAYGPPSLRTQDAVVWLKGVTSGAGDDPDLLQAVRAAGPGGEGLRIELTRELGVDRAKLTLFRNAPAG